MPDLAAILCEGERLQAAIAASDLFADRWTRVRDWEAWMPMLALIAWVGRIARAALGEEGK